MNQQRLSLVAVGLLILTIGVYGYIYFGGDEEHRRPAEELARQALTAPTSEAREQAARDLADHGTSAVPQCRRVLAETETPGVRAVMVQALGAAYDFESTPKLLDSLDDPDSLVRQRAGVAVSTILGLDYHFRADASPEERAVTVRHYRSEYDKMLKNPPPKYRRN